MKSNYIFNYFAKKSRLLHKIIFKNMKTSNAKLHFTNF
jgi:hypothetical protein